ncbi:MAG TPA: DUF3857 and transglutaminase domain-containing protein [Candidatus Koribacter sp.]|jgi:hypothetical protein
MNRLFLRLRISALALLGLGCVLAIPQHAQAKDSVPDWFRQIAHEPLAKYSEETDAVVLLDETTYTVQPNGETYLHSRRVVKILRPGGKRLAVFEAGFDKDTKLTQIHGWSISADGMEYELKEKDSVETSPFADAMYEDDRQKLMKLPGAEVGAYVAFEFEQKQRPLTFWDTWDFQETVPVKTARYTINLPAGWEYQYRFGNFSDLKPKNMGGNIWQWEVHDIDPISDEDQMPAWGALAGKMAVAFYSPSLSIAKRMSSWNDVAAWSNTLNESRRVGTPKLQAKVAELIAGKTTVIDKVRAIGEYVQHNIRYVEIQLTRTGAWQAHAAGEVFDNNYGDCKDKATLLVTMLHEAGINAYMVLVDSERGVVNPALPTPWTFNHMIVAVKLPADADTSAVYATVDDQKLGKLLFFDPTYDVTGFGLLPAGEQNSYGLVITGDGGELVKMPQLAPPINRLLRVSHLELLPNGGLTGDVEETRMGQEATRMREALLTADKQKKLKVIEEYLAQYLDHAQLTYAGIGGLSKYDEPLTLHYKFVAADYATSAGDLLMVRPRVLGQMASSIAEEKKPRKYPITYSTTSLRSDVVEIKLPQGYKVDELPQGADVKTQFAEYKSKIEAKDNVLYYNRSYTVKDLSIPVDEYSELKAFMRGIAADERNTAVLKKTQ